MIIPRPHAGCMLISRGWAGRKHAAVPGERAGLFPPPRTLLSIIQPPLHWECRETSPKILCFPFSLPLYLASCFALPERAAAETPSTLLPGGASTFLWTRSIPSCQLFASGAGSCPIPRCVGTPGLQEQRMDWEPPPPVSSGRTGL